MTRRRSPLDCVPSWTRMREAGLLRRPRLCECRPAGHQPRRARRGADRSDPRGRDRAGAGRRGLRSVRWKPHRGLAGHPESDVCFSPQHCMPCPVRERCTRSETGACKLTLGPREEHEAIRRARRAQQTTAWGSTTRSAPVSRAPSGRGSASAVCADPATADWPRPACNMSSPPSHLTWGAPTHG